MNRDLQKASRSTFTWTACLLLVLFAFETATALTCGDAFAPAAREGAFDLGNLSRPLPTRISIAELQDENPTAFFYPNFKDPESVEEFLDTYPAFGFASVGPHILFVSPRKGRFKGVNWDVLTESWLIENPSAIRIQELPRHEVIDITHAPFMNEKIRNWHGLKAWDEGPNCWNLCQMYHGWARTSFMTSEREFNLWVNGPFARPSVPVSPFAQGRPGDIIVIRQRDFATGQYSEVHGAVLLTDKLVLTKNGTDYEAPMMIESLSSMIGTYVPHMGNSVELIQIRSFNDVWQEWRNQVSPTLANGFEEWLAYEAEHASYFIPSKTSAPIAAPRSMRERRRALQNRLKTEASRAIAELETKNRSTAEEVELFFWRLLASRTTTSYF